MSTSSSDNQRRFTRIPFLAQSEISSVDGKSTWPCDLLDISLHGALTTRPEGWHGDRDALFLLQSHLSDDSTTIEMEVRVAHVEDDRIGFVSNHMDLDSATHLRRLVELNLGNEALLERELMELLEQSEP